MSPEVVISGVGVLSPVGVGKEAVSAALLRGDHAFGVMRRPGRQRDSEFIGAEIGAFELDAEFSPRLLRGASWSSRAGLAATKEAWTEARVGEVDGERVGLIVGGSNFQQRENLAVHETHAARARFIRPTYGLTFSDTDLCGVVTQHFGIRGPAFCVAGASASGQLAVIQAAQAVRSGEVDVCVALGALMDLSYVECHALRSLGAMGSDRFAREPVAACRPFDRGRDGFIYGENCAALVLESAEHARARGITPYAQVSGWGVVMAANRNADPSVDGEVRAIRRALDAAGWTAAGVDYVNPHGSGSVVGDETELDALGRCGLAHARINSTKSILGHGLSAAGASEVAATLLQMKARALHPSRNLEDPVAPHFNWVGASAIEFEMRDALTLSFGFGGINTALCLRRWEVS